MRRQHDFYPTPSWATKVLISRFPIEGWILEPCVGRGDISKELGTIRDAKVETNDIDRQRPALMHSDASDRGWWRNIQHHEWVVTNPPFNLTERILPMAVEHAKVGVAMLLRLTYLEPCEGRRQWLKEYPPTALIVLPRISFTGDGHTDSVTCGWMVWQRGVSGQSIEIVHPATEAARLPIHVPQADPCGRATDAHEADPSARV